MFTKAFLTLSILGMSAILTNAYIKRDIASDKFMSESDIKFVKRLDDVGTNENGIRIVASLNQDGVDQKKGEKTPYRKEITADLQKLITNNVWKLNRIVNDIDEEQVLNKNVVIEVIKTGINGEVIIKDFSKIPFFVSLNTDSTLALWRYTNSGFEIVEAEKSEEKKIEASSSINNNQNNNNDSADATNLEEESMDLKLINVIKPRMTDVLGPNDVSGSVSISSGSLENFNVSIQKAANIKIDHAEIKGNTFSYEDGEQILTGTIYKSSNGEVAINLVNGANAGVKFIFMKEADYLEKTGKEELNKLEQDTLGKPVELTEKENVIYSEEDQNSAVQERTDVANETAEAIGFKF